MNKKIINTKTTKTSAIAKRWSVVRATTGSVVRSFETRADARSYKSRGNFKIMDNVNGLIVR